MTETTSPVEELKAAWAELKNAIKTEAKTVPTAGRGAILASGPFSSTWARAALTGHSDTLTDEALPAVRAILEQTLEELNEAKKTPAEELIGEAAALSPAGWIFVESIFEDLLRATNNILISRTAAKGGEGK